MSKEIKKMVALILSLALIVTSAIPSFASTVKEPTKSSVYVSQGTTCYGWTTRSCTVYDCPWTDSMVIGSLGIEQIGILWQTSDYYYVQYNTDSGSYGGTKMGYVPKSCVNPAIQDPSWIAQEGYQPKGTWGKTQEVFDCPRTDSMEIGTVSASDNVIILDNSDYSYYFIQYPAPSAPGGYKRGWVKMV
ncbi:MAG TPA: hypothetical protein VHO94_03155 [Oscillospiraceae bacterium]|nr:hypothetical protein [Oscillospiraceae bacterium]